MCSPITHASIAIIGKSIDKKAPLLLLLFSTQLPEMMFFLLQFLGIESQANPIIDFKMGFTYLSSPHIPWSHGLLMCILYSILLASITFIFLHRLRTACIVGLMVISHWVLDFLVYNNLPLFLTDTPTAGIGLVTSAVGVKIAIGIEVIGVAALLIFGIPYFLKIKHQKAALEDNLSIG